MMIISMEIIRLADTGTSHIIIRHTTGTGHMIRGMTIAGTIRGIIPGIRHTMAVGVDITRIMIHGIGVVVMEYIPVLRIQLREGVHSVRDGGE
jgi:hypothetical protein